MVEGTMIFPLVIVTIVALVIMMTYFYVQLSERVDMHILLRAKSGELCKNMYYVNYKENNVPVYKKAQQIYSQDVVKIENKLMLKGQRKEVNSRKYLIDECRFIRTLSIFGEEKDVKSE